MSNCEVCGAKLSSENKYMDGMCWDCKFGGHEEYTKDRDWTGNKKSIFVTLGASNHCDHDRAENDFYSTDPKALEIFLDKLKEDGIELNHYIWECACGNGALSEVLINRGHDVWSSDLVDRGYGLPNCNFLACDKLPFGRFDDISWDILTNPPYKYAQEFVEHSMDLVKDGSHVVMFLKIQFLEGKERRKLFDKYPPKYVYVNSARQICYLNGDTSQKMSSATCYCWYIWEKGWKGDPIIKWI